MARAPYIKVYDRHNEYEACCKSYETAAAIVSFLGTGSTIRFGHAKSTIVWTEGADGYVDELSGIGTSSYDDIRETCLKRQKEKVNRVNQGL